MAAVWPLQGMSAAQKAVLVSLADQANDDGVCWPAVDKIAMRTCLSERSVQEALRWLQTTGAVFRQYRENTSSLYTVSPQNYNPSAAPEKRIREKKGTGADSAPPADGAPGANSAPPPANGTPDPRKRRTPPPQTAHRGVANGAPKSSNEPSLNRNGTANEPFQPAAQAGGDGGDAALKEAYLQACRDTWAAYEQAYQLRYGTVPVRNAKVNTAVAQIVKRLGATEAPQVAGWFVSFVNEAFVVKRCHAVGDLLSQCEAYRTQWVAGISMTSTAARQADKTAANHSVVPGAADKARQIIAQRRDAQAGGGAHAG